MTHAQPRPLPQATDVTKPFWEAAAGHRLVIQACRRCGTKQFYPRNLCTACSSDEIDWVPSTGRGTIYTFTINHRAPNEFMKQRLPYAVAMIQLDDGVRMMANIIDTPLERITIGARVKVVFERVNDEVSLPQFMLED